ncbi:MAG: hypothetical protein GW789_11160, partial [Ignavibacteria bacterium]|nr:hypothetical protein [Ignavibacteria bacterium]
LLREELKNQLEKVKTTYDELYIAQNQIVKETKMVNTLELLNKIKTEMFQPQTYDALISGLKNVKNFQQVLDQINLFKEKNLSYLDNAEKEIKKSTRH